MLKFHYKKTWDTTTENQTSGHGENNHGSGNFVISKESERNMAQLRVF